MEWSNFQPEAAEQRIAVIGMAGRFPDADNVAQFWQNLHQGKVSINQVPQARWDAQANWIADRTQAMLQAKSCSKWGAFLADSEHFDALFFNLAPNEAAAIDPQERLFLQSAWAALEDAGYPPDSLSGKPIGVFAAVTKTGFELYGAGGDYLPTTSFSSIPNRVSHLLGVTGPSLPIDTMCSSSLVALDLACQQLRSGRCEMALVGGVNLYEHPAAYIRMTRNGMLADSPQARIFGNGTGFVPGEAAAVVVLKPLMRALEDGDAIYGCICGSSVNHSGHSAGYLAPNPQQQQASIQAALKAAGVVAAELACVEVAANGSHLGDAVEMRALQEVFSTSPGTARLGSVKPQVGHAEAAAGMVQLIKMLLQFRHQTLLPSGIEPVPDANIDWSAGPLQLASEARPWLAGAPRRALICNVGAGGVNAHLVLEDYPAANIALTPAERFVFILSAKTEERLRTYAAEVQAFLLQQPMPDAQRFAAAFAAGRSTLAQRLAIIADDLPELRQKLAMFTQGQDSWNIYTGQAGTLQDRPSTDTTSLTALAENWCNGVAIDWRSYWHARFPQRQRRHLPGLPLYPFSPRLCSLRTQHGTASEAGKTQDNATSEHYENKAAEFYTRGVELAGEDYREEYLTFCPFPQEVPGFSQSRYFISPESDPEVLKRVQDKQIEMRQVLFYQEDFRRLQRVLDFGCGHGTDVIRIAELYPHLETTGFTITLAQADLGNKRIAQKGLSSRATIFHADSSKNLFPAMYDLIFGIEVSFHIRDKFGLFKNIAGSLAPGGRLLLMDYFTNLRGAIVDTEIEISIPTVKEWVETLSHFGLLLDQWVDVSPQIANFLQDPEVEHNTLGQTEVVRKTLISYANQAVSLRNQWISYCLLKISKDQQGLSLEQRRKHNQAAFQRGIPYPQALETMLAGGYIPYPRRA